MPPDTNTTIEIVALIAFCVAVLGSVYLLHRSRTRARDARLKLESTQSDDERAFNQIRIASAGADHLQREGYDVGPIQAVLAQARDEDQRGHHGEALRLVETARRQLVTLRTNGHPVSATAAFPAPRAPPPSPVHPRAAARSETSSAPPFAAPRAEALTLAAGTSASEDEDTPPRAKLPAHQVEARFALTELGRDLAKSGVGSEARRLAEESRREANDAYGQGRFADAWRLALRGRRQLGVLIEGVGGPAPSRAAALAPATPTPASTSAIVCPSCGAPSREGDQFCRSCGAALEDAACPRCGAHVDPGDRFCPACGGPTAG
ncbi:MAG TPA: zinc ribbon domain-containing protein [Thermoplasmata archaeon]|nr:zinc ribbon domain-containing protein [Thermoplasmata archaeon]